MSHPPFYRQKGNVYAVPALHYTMESAAQVLLAYKEIQPDAVAVELPEPLTGILLHAASRLPDISIVRIEGEPPEYLMVEPCDPLFEALRLAQESGATPYCIDLAVKEYPQHRDPIPDPYAIQRIGLEKYYTLCEETIQAKPSPADLQREQQMAKRLKELSLRHDKVLFVGGLLHIERVLALMDQQRFPEHPQQEYAAFLHTLTEDSLREVMGESGWNTLHYEVDRLRYLNDPALPFPPDRQRLLLSLYKRAGELYQERSHFPFEGYHLRNVMKFVRNYSFVQGKLMPDLVTLLRAAKGCVDHNYAYEVWEQATDYPFLKNIDNLEPLHLTPKDVWGRSTKIHFHRKELSDKSRTFQRRHRKDRRQYKFEPNQFMGICSYPPEDVAVETFGGFLQKKGNQLFSEEGAKTIAFSTSLEDGIDTRETIRHWHEKQLYVKVRGKPSGGVGSIVVIFDEDNEQPEGYPWKTTWLGEHDQESDMALYSTRVGQNLVGPGISRCTYGGFMMSYPPRRMYDVWQDPDYAHIETKSETLLAAAIDYAVNPLVVYVAARPPRPFWKSYASRYTKRLVYLPIGQLSPSDAEKNSAVSCPRRLRQTGDRRRLHLLARRHE